MLAEARNKSREKQGRRSSSRVGEAVCDMKGELWEVDAAFLLHMKDMVPGWFGGNLPSNVLEGLKNTGRFQAGETVLTAEFKDSDKIMLLIRFAG